MVTHTAYILTGLLTLLASSALSFGQSGRTYNYAHIRYAEGEVTLQRALEPEASEAIINVPVMAGDRLWTATYGRAEIVFADGSVLQMDERTKVDFTAFGETAGAETLLRLWNGSLILRIVDASAASYRIDTPSGSVFPVSEGLFRIDVDETGNATLSVYEGVAELASETGSVLVRTGQRSFVQQSLRPASPLEFNTARYDAFASWSDGREQLHRHTRRIEGVPDEVAVYTGELQHYGSWRHEASHGSVWYPTVSVGWSPYTQGRWLYTSFGWTWISHEPWGWAPYHYGRWGHGSLGWYWIPGAHWGPAWVSWAFGPTWVGWSPLGYYNRPLFPYRSVFHHSGGRTVSHRGRGYAGHGWSFVKKDHFRSIPVERTRLRVEDVRATANQGRLFESGAVLDRELRPRAVGAAAMTRMPRTTRASGRTSAANPSSSAPANRGGLATIRRGPRATPQNQGGASTSRGVAMPRFAPRESRGNDTTAAGSSPSGSPSARSPRRSSNSQGSPSSEASSFRRISSGPQRGDTGSRGTGVTRRSSTPYSPTGTAGTVRRSPSRVPNPSQLTGSRRGAATTGTPSGMTRRPAVERSKASSAGSKDFFRRPASGSRSRATGSTAKPRTSGPSNNRSSQAKSSSRPSNRSSNQSSKRSSSNRNRNSSRPRK